MPLWLEMPATTTVDQTGVHSVPIRGAGYQKQRVTVMLAQARSAMLILDSYRGHLTDEVKEKFSELNIVPMVIPAGWNLKKPPPEVVLRWVFRAWKAVPADLIKKAFLTCGISNALDGSEDKLAMTHKRGQLKHEVDVDDDITADGFWGNNYPEPESDDEEY
ncbi:unnamed protein product [Closterium sp. NIES-53]